MEAAVSIFVLLIGISGITWGYLSERKVWNNGICAVNGLPWVRFDQTDLGDRGYKAGDQYCWISYPWID